MKSFRDSELALQNKILSKSDKKYFWTLHDYKKFLINTHITAVVLCTVWKDLEGLRELLREK